MIGKEHPADEKIVFSASVNKRFRKGQVLQVTGPAEFPFTLEMTVLSNTSRIGQVLGSTHTRLLLSSACKAIAAVNGRSKPKEQYILQHWSDIENFCLLLPEKVTGTMNDDSGIAVTVQVKEEGDAA